MKLVSTLNLQSFDTAVTSVSIYKELPLHGKGDPSAYEAAQP